ncbi:MAG TPA: LytTR family DNA-binding domain-containing protein [Puia sp.]
MNVVIIEDEILSGEDLAYMIGQINADITILAHLRSVKESIAYLKGRTDVDLIFSDIQLGDGLSFEIFRSVRTEAPIIFCTAFNEYAVEAFKTNSIDYILKPFDNKAVAAAINKYYQLKKYFAPTAVDYDSLIHILAGRRRELSSILVYYKDKVLPINLDEIALFYIDKETTRLLSFSKKIFIVDQTLDQLEHSCGDDFFRVNRQYLVNRRAVTDATHYFPRKYVVNISLDFKEAIVVSKNRTSDFLKWLTKK